MNIIQIEDALYNWLNGLLGLEVIIAYPNAPRPTTSYALINIITDSEFGTEESDGELTPIYASFNQVTISINTYYAASYQSAINIKKSLMKVEVSDQLWEAGLGYATSTQIQKIPELIDKRWEERAQFDIVFNIREETAIETVGQIEKVQLTNEIDGTTTTIGE